MTDRDEALLPAGVWSRAVAGVGPDGQSVADVAAEQAAALGSGRVRRVESSLRSQVLGAGPLDEWLTDPRCTDVVLNGDGRVWVDRGEGMQLTPTRVPSGEARALAVRLAAHAGRRLDDASPTVDGLLPSGVRLHAILPPLVEGGAHVTLRVPSPARWSLDDLVARGMCPDEWAPVLRALVDARAAFLISGGTGAGKTTLLAALLGLARSTERIVVVEDVRELAIAHDHVVRLEARPPNVEGLGEVTMTALVRQALRMRPDRIVVGEVRGAEVRELLAALNTGHEGGCGTVHANSTGEVPARFEALGALAGLGPDAVRRQLGAAIDVLLHIERVDGVRRLREIATLGITATGYAVEPALSLGAGATGVRGPGWPALDALLRRGGAWPDGAAS